MKFRKSLIAAMLTGAGVIAVAPAINAAEYSTSVSGNIRVEATTVTKTQPSTDENGKATSADITASSTSFGGDDDEANTGGDTYLQWNHNFANDEGTTTGGGFLRFKSDGVIRTNVYAESELGNYKGELKAEWEQRGFNGVELKDDVVKQKLSERDQFAKLTHVPIGLYYKIGREQWLDNNKGYTSDFLSQTEKFAWVSDEARFAAHALGWSGAGIDVALLIQRDNTGQASAKPSGQSHILNYLGADLDLAFSKDTGVPVLIDGVAVVNDNDEVVNHQFEKNPTGDVSGFGVLFSYDGGDSIPVQADLNVGSATQASNKDRIADTTTVIDDVSGEKLKLGGVDKSVATSFTQFHLAFPIGAYVPFLNFGSSSQKHQLNGKDRIDGTVSGWNLGASLGFGPTDLVVAYGTQAIAFKDIGDSKNSDADTSASGFDLIWATNQEPLKVSLAYTSSTTTTPNNKDDVDKSENKYGVRLDFGF